MLAFLGSAGVAVAFAGAGLLLWRTVASLRRGSESDLEGPVWLVVTGSVVAMVAMQIALAVDDFDLAYLANNHSSTTPFPFDVATAWAALEGSILLWGLVLAGFTWVVLRRHRSDGDDLGVAALGVMAVVGLFFFGLMLTVANPFEVCVEAMDRGCAASSPWPFAAVSAPVEGPGPNPLLQNHILMAVHPPMLYLGYVGLTVPFAFAVGALALGRPGPDWLHRSHRSTLVAWSFLTLGIVLGGWWAYTVLSWGGYWAWDPVENASLMPWLVATAFLHSGLVQQRKGMLQAWNFVLVIGAFSLTILGTFLTRSGTINSVHSFTQSAIGPALLGFLVLVLVGSFSLFAARSHLVASSPRLDSFVSREGSFLANNLLLAVYAFVVLVGTIYPLALEAFTGTQIGVGEPFFNRIAVPLSFLLLLVMGIGPITPWGRAGPDVIWRRSRGPGLAAVGAGLLTALLVTRNGWAVLAVVSAVFVIGVIVSLLVHQARRRSGKTGKPLTQEMRTVLLGDQAFWAGQVSHVGVALVAISIAFAANLGTHLEVSLSPGDSVVFEELTITYRSPFQQAGPGKVTRGAGLEVSQDGAAVRTLEPAANYFGEDPIGVSTPDLWARPGGDLYATLLELDSEQATITLDTSPMIWLLWLGGLVVSLGGLWSVQVRRQSRREVVDTPDTAHV